MPSKQIHFVADRGDLLDAVSRVEGVLRVKFVDAWAHDSPKAIVYESLQNWPKLGISEGRRDIGFFLVVPKATNVRMERFELDSGAIEYMARPQDHPESIILETSVVFLNENQKVEIPVGKIGTALSSKESMDLYSKFRRLFLKDFVCHR